jgi:hypothetical protein
MHRIQEMRGGKDYDSDFATRMKGSGTWAALIGQRFRKTADRLGFNAKREKARFGTDLFRPPSPPGQSSLF